MIKNYVGLKAVGMGFDAHLTVMYTGDLYDTHAADVQSVIKALGNPTFYVDRGDIRMFGPPGDRVPVLLIKPSASLVALRKSLEYAADFIPNPSEFAWNPHITLKFEPGTTLRIPSIILLTKLDLY